MSEVREKRRAEPLAAAYGMMEGVMRPEEERHPLCRDCADWDSIPQALVGCAIAVMTLVQRRRLREAVQLMRAMAESLYALGYQRGQREAQQPRLQLVLAEEGR